MANKEKPTTRKNVVTPTDITEGIFAIPQDWDERAPALEQKLREYRARMGLPELPARKLGV